MGRRKPKPKLKIQELDPKDAGNPFSASLRMVGIEQDKASPELRVKFEILHRTNCPNGTEINENMTLVISDVYKYDCEVSHERRVVTASFPLSVEDNTSKGAMTKLSRFLRRISEAMTALERENAFDNLEADFFIRAVKVKRESNLSELDRIMTDQEPS